MQDKLYYDPKRETYVCFAQDKGIWYKLGLKLAEVLPDSVRDVQPPTLTSKILGTTLNPIDLEGGLVEDKNAIGKVALNLSDFSSRIKESRGRRKENLIRRQEEVITWLSRAQNCVTSNFKK